MEEKGVDNLSLEVNEENTGPQPMNESKLDRPMSFNIGPSKSAAQLDSKSDDSARLWQSPEDGQRSKSNHLHPEKNGGGKTINHSNSHASVHISVSCPPSPVVNTPTSENNNSANNNNNNNSETATVVDFDDVLPYVGEFGTYQIILFFLTAPFCFFLAFSYFSQVFITLIPEHWCNVPELQNAGLTTIQRRELSSPPAVNPVLGATPSFDSCLMYDIDYKSAIKNHLKPNASWKTIPCRNGWEYDLEQTRYHTIVSEYDWVCENAGKPPLAQALFFCGSIVGGIVLGFLADRFGRIPALIVCNLVGAIAGVITTFSYSFGVFAFSRFLMGMAFDNCFTLMYILVLEYVGPNYRTLVANLSIALFYTAGTTILPWIAWALQDWRTFSLVTAVPMVSAIAAYWIVPESARWLLSQGQTDRAIEILRRFARINKKQVDERVYKELKASTDEARQASMNEAAYSVLDLLRTPRLRRNTILLTLLWVIVAVVYDGHARNTANLGLSVFVTFSVASVTELPADLILVFFLDRWGRRALAFGSLFFAAIFSLATLAVPLSEATVSAALAIIGRFCVNITFNVGLQYGAELIPTVVRAQGIAAVHNAGYVAAIVSPYIVDLARISRILPLTILGILAIIGAIVALMLPETLDTIMPQTMEDGENFGKDQQFWDFPCCSKKRTADSETETDESKAATFEPNTWMRNSLRTSVRGEALRSSLLCKSAVRNSQLRKAVLRRTLTTRD